MNRAPGLALLDIWNYWGETLLLSPSLDDFFCSLAWEDKPGELYLIRARLRREIALYYDYWGCLDAPLP
jgi:hypothetical protein